MIEARFPGPLYDPNDKWVDYDPELFECDMGNCDVVTDIDGGIWHEIEGVFECLTCAYEHHLEMERRHGHVEASKG